jgi:hypothetical protein
LKTRAKTRANIYINVRKGKLSLYGRKFTAGIFSPYLTGKDKRKAALSKKASARNRKI